MTKPLLLLLLLPLPAFAAAIDASAAAIQATDAAYAVGLVGGSVLGVYAALNAFRYVREVIGVASPLDTPLDLAPPVRGYVDQASYLEALGQRLAAENEAASMKAEREEIFLAAADHQTGEEFSISEGAYSASMRQDAVDAGADMALYDRFLSQDATHDEALRWSVEAAAGEIRLPVLPSGIDPAGSGYIEGTRDVYEDGRLSSWDVDGRYIGPPQAFDADDRSTLSDFAAPLMEFDDDAVSPSASPAVDYGSAFDDFLQQEAEVSAWARSEAEKSGADMALYDKFIAEDGVTFEEAARWSSMGGQVKMPVEPGTSSDWDAQGNYVAPLKSWELR